MIRIGKVTGRTTGKNRDGGDDVLLLQVEISDPDDVQTVQLMNPAGENSNPPDGSQVLIIDIGAAFKVAVATDDGIAPFGSPGDKQIYSADGGIIKAFINLLTSGIIELNGNNDFAVRFNALKTEFDKLKADYNLHTHIYSPGPGGPIATAMAIPQTTADISSAKVDEVKMP